MTFLEMFGKPAGTKGKVLIPLVVEQQITAVRFALVEPDGTTTLLYIDGMTEAAKLVLAPEPEFFGLVSQVQAARKEGV